MTTTSGSDFYAESANESYRSGDFVVNVSTMQTPEANESSDASGLPTGKRQHKPFVVTSATS